MSNDTFNPDSIRVSTSSFSSTSSDTPTSPQLSTARPPNGSNLPVPPSTSSRTRAPAPPSPLSRIQTPSNRDSQPPPLPKTSRSTALPIDPNPRGVNSPCFIHSHLDRHGSLQDWLKSKSNQPHIAHVPAPSAHPQNGSSSIRQHPAHTVHKHHPHIAPQNHHRPAQTPLSPQTASSSGVTSPTAKDGYESDLSSANGVGSAILDGDLMDEEEDGGSLTKQLAETAQGVREMSKELARDNRLIQLTRELALYLMQKQPASAPDGANRPVLDGRNGDRGMVVYVDAQLRMSKRFDAAGIQRDYPHLLQPVNRRRSASSASITTMASMSLGDLAKRPKDEGQLRYWTSEMCSNSPQLFDFVVTLGGDGTVLFTSWLFQRIVPPVLPFALGSLGFLTNFDFAKYRETMDRVVDDGIRVNLRMRFTCTVFRAITPDCAALVAGKGDSNRKAFRKPGGGILMSQVDKGGWEALEAPHGTPQPADPEGKDREIMCFSTRPVEQFEVLNDLVVDRGPSPYVSLLELFGDEHHLTTVQADGLTVSTPTGSTAYSLSAGGSLVHPQIPALLITPICPHTLSFRPMLLPDSMELRICVPFNSRSTAWASFDGRGRVELKQGDHIKVTASKYPFPTVCADKASTEWFSSISSTLRWNEREKQKSFVVVEEDREPVESAPKSRRRQEVGDIKAKMDGVVKEHEEDDDDDDEDEEEAFDIDDKSGEDATPPSPQSQTTDNGRPPPNRLNAISNNRKSGVDSPDRFATPYSAPPPLSQRHLAQALAAAEIQEKENERGDRDDIRSRGNELRVDGPSRRKSTTSTTNNDAKPDGQHKIGKARTDAKSSAAKSPQAQSKAKAFAFFGQDDSASDVSDDAD